MTRFAIDMKVLYINYIDMNNPISGSSVRPVKLYNAMLELGYEVELVTGVIHRGDSATRKKYLKQVLQKIRKEKIDFCYIESMTMPLFRGTNFYEYRFIKKIRKMGIPIALFYRDVYWKFKKTFKMKGLRQYLLARFQKRDVAFYKKNIDVVFLPSVQMNKYLGFKRIYPLPPGCEAKEVSSINNFHNQIIYVGGVSYSYGTDLLIDAMRIVNKTKQVNLKLVCRQDELAWLKPYLKETDCKWLTILNLKANELSKHYDESDFAICSHRKNEYHDFCMPVKLFEYISYCKPILANGCKSMSDIILENHIGYIANDNAEDMAKNILQAYDDICHYRGLVENTTIYRNNNLWINRVEDICRELQK